MAEKQYKVVNPWTSQPGKSKASFKKGDLITASDAKKDNANIDNLVHIGAVELVEAEPETAAEAAPVEEAPKKAAGAKK